MRKRRRRPLPGGGRPDERDRVEGLLTVESNVARKIDGGVECRPNRPSVTVPLRVVTAL